MILNCWASPALLSFVPIFAGEFNYTCTMWICQLPTIHWSVLCNESSKSIQNNLSNWKNTRMVHNTRTSCLCRTASRRVQLRSEQSLFNRIKFHLILDSMHNNGVYIFSNIPRGRQTRETTRNAAWQRYADASTFKLWSIKQWWIKWFGIVENAHHARSRVGAYSHER